MFRYILMVYEIWKCYFPNYVSVLYGVNRESVGHLESHGGWGEWRMQSERGCTQIVCPHLMDCTLPMIQSPSPAWFQLFLISFWSFFFFEGETVFQIITKTSSVFRELTEFPEVCIPASSGDK